MKMNIELARATDVNEIEALYGAVVDDLLANVNYPGWKKGIYPTRDEAIFGIEKKELYVMRQNDQIVGSIVINHRHLNGRHQIKMPGKALRQLLQGGGRLAERL